MKFLKCQSNIEILQNDLISPCYAHMYIQGLLLSSYSHLGVILGSSLVILGSWDHPSVILESS